MAAVPSSCSAKPVPKPPATGPGSRAQAAVVQTNDEAATSRLSAAQLGYFNDEFVQHFVAEPRRRAPIINRGTFARAAAADAALDSFLGGRGAGAPVQVLLLGAGFSTAFFCRPEASLQGVDWFELDFPEVMEEKARLIRKNPVLHCRLAPTAGAEPDAPFERPGGSRYELLGADLAALEGDGGWVARLAAAGFDCTKPTLVQCEAVLMYMEPDPADALVRWAATALPQSAFVVYDVVNGADAFGQMMKRNIAARGCPLRSIDAYPDVPSQVPPTDHPPAPTRRRPSGPSQSPLLDRGAVAVRWPDSAGASCRLATSGAGRSTWMRCTRALWSGRPSGAGWQSSRCSMNLRSGTCSCATTVRRPPPPPRPPSPGFGIPLLPRSLARPGGAFFRRVLTALQLCTCRACSAAVRDERSGRGGGGGGGDGGRRRLAACGGWRPGCERCLTGGARGQYTPLPCFGQSGLPRSPGNTHGLRGAGHDPTRATNCRKD